MSSCCTRVVSIALTELTSVKTLTEDVQLELDGVRVDGRLYRYRVPTGGFRRKLRSDARMHSFTIDETTRSVRLMPDITGLDALSSYMASPCVKCSVKNLVRYIFDARTQLALRPLQKQFKHLMRLHSHAEKLSVELGYIQGSYFSTSITLSEQDPLVAVTQALQFIEQCCARSIQMAVPELIYTVT